MIGVLVLLECSIPIPGVIIPGFRNNSWIILSRDGKFCFAIEPDCSPLSLEVMVHRKDRNPPNYGGIHRKGAVTLILDAWCKVEKWMVEPFFIQSTTPFEGSIIRKIRPAIENGSGDRECVLGASKVVTPIQHPCHEIWNMIMSDECS